MTEDNFRKEWRWDRKKMDRHHRSNQALTGFFLLLIGTAALLKATMPEFPDWLFSWPMILIVIGVYSGIKSGFRNTTWFLLMLVGTVFLAGQINPDLHLRRFAWPIVFIAIGLFFIYNSSRSAARWSGEKKNRDNSDIEDASVVDQTTDSKEDFVDATSIFGGTKKNILSKNFKGGNIVNIFGGTEINLGQAEIQGQAVIDTTTIFGGFKLIIPSHWAVKSEAAVVFGGIEDKRTLPVTTNNPEKILLLKGTVIFGGIDIKSY